ncbi:MAG: hypothetical protein ACOYT8_04705 [Candidatus Dependentiae bacterium]
MKKILLVAYISASTFATEIPHLKDVEHTHHSRPYFSPYFHMKWVGKFPVGVSLGLYQNVDSNNWQKIANSVVAGFVPSKESLIKPFIDEQCEKIIASKPFEYNVLGLSVSNKKIAHGASALTVALMSIWLKTLQGKNFVDASWRYATKEIKRKMVALTYKKLVSLADRIAQKKGHTKCDWYPDFVTQDQTLHHSVKTLWHLTAKIAISIAISQLLSI